MTSRLRKLYITVSDMTTIVNGEYAIFWSDAFKETFPCIFLEEDREKSQSEQSLPWPEIEAAIDRMRRRTTYISF